MQRLLVAAAAVMDAAVALLVMTTALPVVCVRWAEVVGAKWRVLEQRRPVEECRRRIASGWAP